MKRFDLILLLVIPLLLTECHKGKSDKNRELQPVYKSWECLTVTASAYNSVKYQTDSLNPRLTAWGDTLKPGTKAIAVSRDLIKMGLKHNSCVKIEGIDGYYKVMDKMHYRWKKKIDIYHGDDIQKAKKWGQKKVVIYAENLRLNQRAD